MAPDHTRRSIGLGFVLLCLLTSCGGTPAATGQVGMGSPVSTSPVPASSSTSTSTSTSTPRSTSTSPSTGPGPTTSLTVPDVVSPLQRKEVPPGGVAEQFSLGSLAFTGGCSKELDTGTTAERVEVGDRVDICTGGFAAGNAIAVTMTRPDGKAMTPDVSDNGHSVQWRTGLGDPLGVYVVTARQGSLTATTRLRLESPTPPAVFAIPPVTGRAGSTFRVGLAGLAPGRTVQPDLYRFDRREGVSNVFRFQAALPTVRTDAMGQAVVEVQTVAGDPDGNYCIVPRGLVWEPGARPGGKGDCNGFDVQRP